jgi:NAD(P)-dependent dehydrogenase (short-subunit alcohol dehydrogenase family)
MELSGKVAIITGGAAGIGRATAELFSMEGASVVIADLDKEAGKDVENKIKQEGGMAIFVPTDVSKRDQVVNLIQSAVGTFGGIDILFNNAGILVGGTVLDLSEEEWRRIMDINLTSMFLCSKEVAPYLIKRGKGVIVNTSSATGAYLGSRGAVAYVTSKGGAAIFTRCLAIDLAKYNIRVNAIAPAVTITPMHTKEHTLEAINEWCNVFPMQRAAYPSEVAQAVLYLASDRASYVTGAILSVDGGQTAQAVFGRIH